MSSGPYLRLPSGVDTKRLEALFLYDERSDELYEVNEEAFVFLRRCDGTRNAEELKPEAEFLESCLEEGLLERLPEPFARRLPPDAASPIPSLRYLEVQLTARCNLACAHCYLGSPSGDELPLDRALETLRQFETMQGLRVLLTGGEPLLYSRFWELNERFSDFAVRFVLLTNATLVTEDVARRLRVQEVQVSLDGLEPGHDLLRGPGAYRRARAGLVALREAGIPVSVATMAHRGNLGEFEPLARDLAELGVREWGIDVPCVAGNWSNRPDLAVSAAEGAACLGYAFGGSYHGGGSGNAGCGQHLATITPTGQLLRCGFYPGEPLGNLEDGLAVAWARRRPWVLEGTRCGGCEALAECAGGCRYRAGGPRDPDPVMCAVHGQGEG